MDIPADWDYRHNMARLFYLSRRDQILRIWRTAEQGEGLRPRSWTRFVESAELWEMARFALMCHTPLFRAAFGATEVVQDAETAIVQGEEYFFVPVGSHTMIPVDEKVLETIGAEARSVLQTQSGVELGAGNWAQRQFIKTIAAYTLADVSRQPVSLRYVSRPQPLVLDYHKLYPDSP